MGEETNVQLVEEDGDIVFDPADFPEAEPAEEPEETPVEEPEETPVEEPEGEPEGEPQEEAPAEEELFEVGEGEGAQKLNRADTLALAKKGQGYDALVQQAQELRRQLEEARASAGANEGDLADLKALAEASGKSVAEFLDALKISERVNRTGMKKEAAAEEVAKERAARNAAAEEAEGKAAAAQEAQKQARERAQADVANFRQRWPDVQLNDRKQVPQEVWDKVFAGEDTLVGAYSAYKLRQAEAENKRLRDQAEAAKKNQENKAKAMGSMRSHGQGKVDDFLAGFNDE